MEKSAAATLMLKLTAEELTVLNAAIASGLEELRHTEPAGSADERRLQAVQQRAAALPAAASFRLPLDGVEAALLRRYVAMVMIMRGYFVGRTEAINALVSVHSKLDRMLE